MLKDFFKSIKDGKKLFTDLCGKMGVSSLPDAYFEPKTRYTQIKPVSLTIERALLDKMAKAFYWSAFRNKAEMHEKLGEHEQALQSHLQISRFFPYLSDTYDKITDYLEETDAHLGLDLKTAKFAEFAEILKRFTVLPSENVLKYRALNWSVLLECYKPNPNHKLVLSYINEMREISTTTDHKFGTDMLTGHYWLKMGNYIEAYKYYEQATQKMESPTIMMSMAAILTKYPELFPDKSTKDALAWYEKAAKMGDRRAKKLIMRLERMIREREQEKPRVSKKNKKQPKSRSKKVKKETSRPLPYVDDMTDDEASDIEDELFKDLQTLPIPVPVQSQPPVPPSKMAEDTPNPASPSTTLDAKVDEEPPTAYQPQVYPKKKTNNPKTARMIRQMAMLKHANLKNSADTPRVVLEKDHKGTLIKIFDLTKPTISEKEFIEFARSDALKPYIRFFQTSSGFALVTRNGEFFEEGLHSAGTHWNHSSKREGLDWNFVNKVREILDKLGITPDKVSSI